MTPQPGGAARAGGLPPAPIDGIFRALSDPTRRDVIGRLSARPASVGDLASHYAMALPSFVAHLKVLERSGLVRSRKTGRIRTYELAPDQLKVAETWLHEQRALWEKRFDQFDAYLLQLNKEETK